MGSPPSGRRNLFLLLVLALAVVLAGCSGAGSDPTAAPDEPDRPAIYETTTAALDDANATAFERTVTDDEGELTPAGTRLLDRLEELDATRRTAVAVSVARHGLDDDALATLDQLLNSTASAREEILSHGLADRTGDGLLDGEARLLGLDPAASHPRVAATATSLRQTGYTTEDVAYLDRVATLARDEPRYQQAVGLGLLDNATANGSATTRDRWAIEDEAGDGLINGLAVEVDRDPAAPHPRLADFATRLAASEFEPVDAAYLHQVARIDGNESQRAQAEYLGLLNETVDDGTVTNDTVRRLRVRPDGLLAGFATTLELAPETRNETVASLAASLAPGGYSTTDVEFLRTAATVSGDPVAYQQAQSLDLLTGPVADGAATGADVDAITDSAGDGLLDGMADRLELDPATAQPVVAEYATPLATGGYGEVELAYLRRIEELASYRNNRYERWSQAEQLGLLEEAVGNGSVTSDQLWQLRNDADNRLLNGMERAFGTDPAAADTSGDGYPDHLAWGPMRDLGLPVTPGEVDVYVEVDTVSGQEPPTEEQREALTAALEEEPAADVGPVNLHFHVCERDRPPVDSVREMNDGIDEYRSVSGLGFHYMLVNDDTVATKADDVPGVTYISRSDPSWMIVDGTMSDRARNGIEASVFAHELGHSFGILDQDFEGVDSRKYTATEYRSVMNYNHWTPVTFSTGDPFDDYAAMAADSFGAYHQNGTALERMWENGSVDDEALC